MEIIIVVTILALIWVMGLKCVGGILAKMVKWVVNLFK